MHEASVTPLQRPPVLPGALALSAAAVPAPAGPVPQDWHSRTLQGHALLAGLLPKVAAHPETFSPNRPGVPLLLAPAAGPGDTLIITFSGNSGVLMLSPTLERLPAAHILAVRDPSRCFGLLGLPGLGVSLSQALRQIQRIARRLGATRIYCIGTSAGGYAALRYGLELGAAGVLGFSAPTTLDIADNPGSTVSTYPQLTALYRRLADARANMALDLVRLYTAASPRPRADLFFAPSHQRDAWLAQRMAHIPGVTLHHVPEDAGHRVFLWLQANNQFADHLARLLAFTPIQD